MAANRGEKSVVLAVKKLEQVSRDIQRKAELSTKKLDSQMNAAINLIYRTATARRPMIMMIGKSKITGLVRGKPKGSRKVSDPSAAFGVPVKTGALRASIAKDVHFIGVRKIKGRVWTDSPYANFLEYGTSKMAARPFIRPALDINKPMLEKIFST